MPTNMLAALCGIGLVGSATGGMVQSAGGETSHQVQQLCPEVMLADDERIPAFDIDLSALSADATVRVCENRSTATSGEDPPRSSPPY